MVYFLYVRMKTNRVITVSVTDIVNTASQTRMYESKKLGVIPGGGGRPGRFAKEASCFGRDAMVRSIRLK